MKKTLAALLTVVFLLAPVAGAMAVSLTLPENPSTGYTWTYTGSSEKVLALLDSSYTPDPGAADKVGAGGTRTWEFQKGEDGDALIRFTLARSDGTKPAKYVNYLYQVKDGKSFLRGEWEAEKGIVFITLPENPSTGYTWRADSDKQGILKLIDNAYTPYTAESLLGQGGRHRWQFSATAPGETAIAFTYGRAWENKGEETFVFVFSVDEGLEVTVVYP